MLALGVDTLEHDTEGQVGERRDVPPLDSDLDALREACAPKLDAMLALGTGNVEAEGGAAGERAAAMAHWTRLALSHPRERDSLPRHPGAPLYRPTARCQASQPRRWQPAAGDSDAHAEDGGAQSRRDAAHASRASPADVRSLPLLARPRRATPPSKPPLTRQGGNARAWCSAMHLLRRQVRLPSGCGVARVQRARMATPRPGLHAHLSMPCAPRAAPLPALPLFKHLARS